MPKRLLVVDPIPTHRIAVAAVLQDAQYEVETAARAGEVQAAGTDQAMLIVGSSGEEPGPLVTAALAGKKTPVLCLDSDAGPMRRLQALRAGARDMLPRNIPRDFLLARLRGLIRERETKLELERRRLTAINFGVDDARAPFAPSRRIVCVGKPETMGGLADMLRVTTRFPVDIIASDTVLRDDSKGPPPDVYVVSATDGDTEVLDEILPELRDRSHSRHVPVLVLYPGSATYIGTRALNLGASDITTQNSSGEELAMRIDGILERKELRDALRRSAERSYQLAATDALTGLFNRRYAESYLADVMQRAQDSGRSFVVMMIDLDHFKSVNDTYGHDAGDRVLKAIAINIRENLRDVDLIARMGGEEFLVVLPDTDRVEVEVAAERLRSQIAKAPVILEDGREISVTASVGVAVCQTAMLETMARTGTFDLPTSTTVPHLQDVLGQADAALYRAKGAGRNRVEISSDAV